MELRTWLIEGRPYAARNKSDARAMAKRAMGIKRQNRGGKKVAGRLPVGIEVREAGRGRI